MADADRISSIQDALSRTSSLHLHALSLSLPSTARTRSSLLDLLTLTHPSLPSSSPSPNPLTRPP